MRKPGNRKPDRSNRLRQPSSQGQTGKQTAEQSRSSWDPYLLVDSNSISQAQNSASSTAAPSATDARSTIKCRGTESADADGLVPPDAIQDAHGASGNRCRVNCDVRRWCKLREQIVPRADWRWGEATPRWLPRPGQIALDRTAALTAAATRALFCGRAAMLTKIRRGARLATSRGIACTATSLAIIFSVWSLTSGAAAGAGRRRGPYRN
jgi:hypothetical protein